jgi:hypothetical protein
VESSRDQSIDQPMRFICLRIAAMFSVVTSRGWRPSRIAAFSAGRPKASYPIGCSTRRPWRRR